LQVAEEMVKTDSFCNNDNEFSNEGIYQGTWESGETDSVTGTNAAGYAALVQSWTDTELGNLITKLRTAISTNHACWPQDVDSYGPFLIRLAWHASGTFRASDNKGGAAGGRIRFHPEAFWPDNANLDKARGILAEVKSEFPNISWGDLIVLAGTLAIYDMGGPTTTVCLGRVDDSDGTASAGLNCDPSDVDSLIRCDSVDADGFAQDQQGLIYVNAQGPNGVPNPYLSAQDIKRTFSRMGMTNRLTTALVGGGHAFGQCHATAGPDGDSITSGFEGPWTTNPTQWDNEYFTNLLHFDWEPVNTRDFSAAVNATHGSGHANIQWQTVDRTVSAKDTLMTTADIGLKAHTDFSPFAIRYSLNQNVLDTDFRQAWELLTTRGPGWIDVKRCIQLDDFAMN